MKSLLEDGFRMLFELDHVFIILLQITPRFQIYFQNLRIQKTFGIPIVIGINECSADYQYVNCLTSTSSSSSSGTASSCRFEHMKCPL